MGKSLVTRIPVFERLFFDFIELYEGGNGNRLLRKE